MFNNFFFPQNLVDYDIKRNFFRVVQATNDKMQRMRLACWKTKTANTHWGCVIRITFPWQQSLRERSSVLSYTYITSCWSPHSTRVSIIYTENSQNWFFFFPGFNCVGKLRDDFWTGMGCGSVFCSHFHRETNKYICWCCHKTDAVRAAIACYTDRKYSIPSQISLLILYYLRVHCITLPVLCVWTSNSWWGSNIVNTKMFPRAQLLCGPYVSHPWQFMNTNFPYR